MKHLMIVLFALTAIATSAFANGRPDPTGRGRYMQYGAEVAYPGAQVVAQLPAGATCAPAGEMVGARVWNSTRAGYAIESVLTDKAQIATAADGRVFLCQCVNGYNQLFLLPSPPAPVAAPVQPSNNDAAIMAMLAQMMEQQAKRDELLATLLAKEEPAQEQYIPPSQPQQHQPSWLYRNRYRIAAGAAFLYGIGVAGEEADKWDFLLWPNRSRKTTTCCR